MGANKEIIIIGGGLAGLICAIDLKKSGHHVTVIEKTIYPHHKVCGEFISNEVRSYLKSLDINIDSLNPVQIDNLCLSTPSGKTIKSHLPLGGFGLSRYTLDNYLFENLKALGCEIINDTVEKIELINGTFRVQTKVNGILTAVLVIGAYGKRAAIDQKLERSFIKRKSPWLAVKAHYKGTVDNNTVFLHNFKGGYCGVSKVENDIINICYLADYSHFKAYKNIEDFQENVLSKNPRLKEIFKQSTAIFEKPITISQISFAKKEPVHEHILMIGDTAGLIHPLCGNGMAMAIHSAKMCAELCRQFITGEINSRATLEKKYTSAWNQTFKNRLATGRILSTIVKKELLFNFLLHLLAKFPALLSGIIRLTHGKPNI